MNIQKSFEDEGGILYLVPTPIGNLEDITFRSVRILKEADMIAAEDTRNTKKLLNHYEIKNDLISYHEHNKETSGKNILKALKEGKTVAIVSDAGMPAISDPGYELVEAAIKEHIPVVSLPGANAALTALTASGLSPQPFYFYGFLPRKKKDRERELCALKNIQATIIFYEAPHRIRQTINHIFEILGDRRVTIARELTKRYEEYVRGKLSDVQKWFENNDPRGEFCLLVEGAGKEETATEQWWSPLQIKEHVDHYIQRGYPTKEAIKQTAIDRNLPKRDVYREYHVK
ncbi:16S rRNA (cytidine(1402)-2'-O)-methyltransferase [Fervidibacillus halotolerans]|uniref:Ribosomal RNA small subunit methyltransferase I n=1 Tax=Fervidibacillus halotolerans TaxID=2980027 RepID=A0A9E8RYL8_9BACI|nr:16S rRNA (cytidine(1402)-2'-O)-methyltransferase [Fervidibacillus halotolerans]WAA12329.1 16S rRNA (cytidine(1402)-2'-O)-methyltransferase [Fervidibacillus halotolerans]